MSSDSQKEIRWSDHAQFKLKLLAERGLVLTIDQVNAIVKQSDRLIQETDKSIAQSSINETLVLRVVYREFEAFVLIITLYPGRRSRYEKDSLQ
ncbi:MAG: DUF4258 domain-containing protein [Cyanobacteria bacterium]|jgi:hypothetical protein|nr:DUF4258 domain-containing protein [Cyanobacteriota bacterium]